ncbi:MAG: YdbL family protein [Methylococcaceae bacterium]|nr:YdbL family protein [Methylococcaceae bacterium]
MKKVSLLSLMLLTACVTINIYFPAAAAEKAADEIIKDIQSVTPQKLEPHSELSDWQLAILKLLDDAMNIVVPLAQAAEADLAINSAEIRQLRTTMESRFASLQPLYASGFIGIQADGLLAVRDSANVPLKARNQVTKLVSAENADRQKLYQAIANANGHPDWAGQIKSTFATRWISNAQAGWWYQSSGTWKQK